MGSCAVRMATHASSAAGVSDSNGAWLLKRMWWMTRSTIDARLARGIYLLGRLGGLSPVSVAGRQGRVPSQRNALGSFAGDGGYSEAPARDSHVHGAYPVGSNAPGQAERGRVPSQGDAAGAFAGGGGYSQALLGMASIARTPSAATLLARQSTMLHSLGIED